jgi:hypothetical protein
MRIVLGIALFALSLCALQPCRADFEPRALIVALKTDSPTLQSWLVNGRSGEINSLTQLVGDHTSHGYVSQATLMCVDAAYARRNQLRVRPSSTRLARIAVVRFSRDIDVVVAARKLATHPDVEYAEPLPVQRIVDTPNDPDITRQYHHNLVKSFDAWSLLPKDSIVVVGVIDTGIDTTHVDLGANTWRNAGEMGTDQNGADRRSNGVDDDGNGFVDDFFGWDFVGRDGQTPDNSPLPGNSHGTHVGGIIAEISNNGIGGAGVATNVRVMAIKIGRDDPQSITVANSADGILYAASMGAAVINCSFGSGSSSTADREVVQQAADLGALVVAAAGNDGSSMAFYPAAYPEVLSVAATGERDKLAFFSNTHSSVDVCAPGVAIYSTIPGNAYDFFDGTSMASPVAAAVAAMVHLRFPWFSPSQLHAAMKVGCDNIDSINAVFVGEFGVGRVNALRALSQPNPRWATVTSWSIIDRDGNGYIQPRDECRVTITLNNELSALQQCAVKIAPAPSTFSPILVQDSIAVGTVLSGETRTLSEAFTTIIPDDATFDGELRLLVLIYDADTVVSRQMITATVNPTYRTLQANRIATTINSIGNIGFNDYPANLQGVGFTHNGSDNTLFEGALMIGTQPRDLPNVVRGAMTNTKDMLFGIERVAEIRTDTSGTGARVTTSFSDRVDPSPVGVDVTSNVYALTADSVRDAIIVALDIRNRLDTTVRDIYASYFFDFDIGPMGANNGCAYDARTGIGLLKNTRDSALPSIGVAMVSPLPTNFFAVDNDGDASSPSIYDNFLRAEKWLMMSGGIRRANSRITDVSAVIGGGPFTLEPGQTQQVCFVISAGSTYDSIVATTSAARRAAQGMGLNASEFTVTPTQDRILFVSGMPVLTSGSTSLIFTVTSPSPVLIDVVDIMGRQVAVLVDELNVPTGTHQRSVNVPSAASGTYFMRMTTYRGASAIGFGIGR